MPSRVRGRGVAPGRGSSVPQPDQRRRSPRVCGTGDAEQVGDLDHRAGQAVDLERLAGLEVLQHRRAVVADGEPGLEPPLDRDRHLDPERARRPPRTPP